MDTSKVYHDIDGNERTIWQMVRREPDWAAVRIQEGEKAIDRAAELENMLEDVVNELDLSDVAIEKHGPLGTPPAELVKLVLAEKDKKIAMLRVGMKAIST